MSSDEVITAYNVAIPEKQEQSHPGLDKHIKPGLEYTKQEVWDDEGNPTLVEYAGSGKLKGKTALITGGDSGLGRSAALMFAIEGARGITITYLPEEEEDVQEAARDIEAHGAKVVTVKCDLMKNADCEMVVNEHIKAFGTLNVLVNNAGKQIICGEFEKIDLDNVHSTFQSNILQYFAVTKFALPHLKRGASIINVTSVTAYKGSKGLIDYSATKGAIVTFTRSLAIHLASKGIRVNGIAPGTIMTALQASTRDADDVEAIGVGKAPLHNRAGQPAEVGPSFVFLASSDANCMTGQIIHPNMGEQVGSS